MTATYAQALAAIQARRELIEAGTPGPWHPATTGVECGDHWSVIEYTAMNQVACIPSNDGSNDEQRQPDARLIAAAVNAFATDTDALAAVLDRHAPVNMGGCGDIDYLPNCRCGCGVSPCSDAKNAMSALGVIEP